ncbi:MAG: CDP-alcohol phosphatidyltransferase family protein [candidate division NC10 bacterium]|nr:CDP-alcohol phosphatidyltransferase family protein [candidate division NC10 bacterium]
MLNLPNQLTLLRILMTPLFVILLLYERRDLALAVFCLAGLTDVLDGFLARIWREKTRLGMILDPLADKLLLTSSFITLAFFLRELPRWLSIIVVSRDLFLIGGSLLLFIFVGKLGLAPSSLGKLTTTLQLLTILNSMLDNFIKPLQGTLFPLVIATAAITIASGLDYIYRGARLLSED